MYRIVSHHLGLPLSSMDYAELLWLDRLGMYIRSEVEGREPQVSRSEVDAARWLLCQFGGCSEL